MPVKLSVMSKFVKPDVLKKALDIKKLWSQRDYLLLLLWDCCFIASHRGNEGQLITLQVGLRLSTLLPINVRNVLEMYGNVLECMHWLGKRAAVNNQLGVVLGRRLWWQHIFEGTVKQRNVPKKEICTTNSRAEQQLQKSFLPLNSAFKLNCFVS